MRFLGGLIILLLAATNLLAQIDAPSKLYFLCESPYYNMTFYWNDNSDNETGFIIQKSTDGTAWIDFETINEANVTSVTLVGFNRNESALFRICATNGTEISAWSDELRVVGTNSKLEVYCEVPGIRNPETLTLNGITFSELQDQCPVEPEQGKATRISTYFSVEVKESNGDEYFSSPTYETRPQIRNNLPQNDPSHTSGHNPYHYGEYGPNSNIPGRTLHSKHWTNFDAASEVILRIKLLDNVPSPQTINMDDLEIMPTPISTTKINDTTLEITLPGATDYTRHFRIGFNREAWINQANRLPAVLEAPLFIFINPIHVAPASAPEDEIKEFKNGQLVVYGSGIHLPNDNYRFFGPGNNETLKELYAPGDAYIHAGYAFKQTSHEIKIWGRALYSDEMFDLYLSSTEYDYSVPGRTPWSNKANLAGTAFSINNYYWEARVLFLNQMSTPSTLEGFTNIGGRMGPAAANSGNMGLINHKDVGYGGGTYQTNNAKAYYKGCFLSNDDDITYVHEDYSMEYCTSYNMVNGPTFQMGWGKFDKQNLPVVVKNHTVFSSDRKDFDQAGKNHGVFNTRLNLESLRNHNGGYYENFDFYGKENIIFKIKVWDEGSATANTTSILGDKTFKNFTIEKNGGLKNILQAESNEDLNKRGYIRFFHFDNLIIEDNQIENIDDGDYFSYNDGVLLHTVTFFSLPARAAEPTGTTNMAGKGLAMFSLVNNKYVQADAGLPESFSPLCSNTASGTKTFSVVNAGDGYVAIKAANGYYVKADAKRYGYLYTIPDTKRGDADTKEITNDAKFKWVELGNDKFALYSKATGLYVRVEKNCGPEMPLYAASAEIGEAETFSSNNQQSFYTLNVNVEGKGTAEPLGESTVTGGSDMVITFTPDAGQIVSNVIVDGKHLGMMSELLIEDVEDHHTVEVTFKQAANRIEAEDFVDMFGVQSQNTGDEGGGQNVGFIGDGDWMDYTFFVSEAGAYYMDFRVASANQNIVIDVMEGEEVLLSIDEPTSGGWQTWKTVRSTSTVNLEVGEYTFRLYATTGNWNINWFSFVIDESLPQYTIETICNDGGYLSPGGTLHAREGASQRFTISTLEKAEITDVLLDGVSLGKVSEVTIEDITSNHQLEVIFESNVGIFDMKEVELIKVFPNPASSYIHIQKHDNLEGVIYLINMQGQVLFNKKTSSKEDEINVSTLPKGTYIVVYISDEGIDKEKITVY